MEIAPGVHNILTDLTHATGVTNTYLVVGSEGAVFVDAGWNRPGEAGARIDYWKKLGSPPLKGIVVTHRHTPHWENAPAIQHACGGAPIIASHAERAEIEVRMRGARVDRPAHDGETLSLGSITLEFVEAPGHTVGSLAVFVRELRALFTGDNVMGKGSSVVNPGEGDLVLYLQTLRKFLSLTPAVIYPGQGPVVSDPRAKLNDLIAHRHERERQIVALLTRSSCSVEEMVVALYAGIDERVRHLAANQVRSHLIKLEAEGRVRSAGERYELAARA